MLKFQTNIGLNLNKIFYKKLHKNTFIYIKFIKVLQIIAGFATIHISLSDSDYLSTRLIPCTAFLLEYAQKCTPELSWAN